MLFQLNQRIQFSVDSVNFNPMTIISVIPDALGGWIGLESHLTPQKTLQNTNTLSFEENQKNIQN